MITEDDLFISPLGDRFFCISYDGDDPRVNDVAPHWDRAGTRCKLVREYLAELNARVERVSNAS